MTKYAADFAINVRYEFDYDVDELVVSEKLTQEVKIAHQERADLVDAQRVEMIKYVETVITDLIKTNIGIGTVIDIRPIEITEVDA